MSVVRKTRQRAAVSYWPASWPPVEVSFTETISTDMHYGMSKWMDHVKAVANEPEPVYTDTQRVQLILKSAEHGRDWNTNVFKMYPHFNARQLKKYGRRDLDPAAFSVTM